jgi:ABC-type amino acid transport substrate-binding protein
MNRKFNFRIHLTAILLTTLLTFTSAIFAAPAIHFKEKNTLSVCFYTEFKPVSYGNDQGYEADLLRAIAKLWQVKVAFYPENTYEGLWLLPTKQHSPCDIAAGGITPASYRIKEGASFTRSTMFFDQSLLVRKKDHETGHITSFRSFKNTNMKIGVVPGTTGEKYAIIRAKANKLPLTVFVQYESESNLLPALIRGDIDAIARGELGNEYQVSLNKDLITIAKQNFKDSFAFAIDASANKPLLDHLNEAIRMVTDDGKISYRQWINNPNVFMNRVKELQKA